MSAVDTASARNNNLLSCPLGWKYLQFRSSLYGGVVDERQWECLQCGKAAL